MFILDAFVSGHFLPTASGIKDRHVHKRGDEGSDATRALPETDVSVD